MARRVTRLAGIEFVNGLPKLTVLEGPGYAGFHKALHTNTNGVMSLYDMRAMERSVDTALATGGGRLAIIEGIGHAMAHMCVRDPLNGNFWAAMLDRCRFAYGVMAGTRRLDPETAIVVSEHASDTGKNVDVVAAAILQRAAYAAV